MPTLDDLSPGQVSLVDEITWEADLLPELPETECYLLQIVLDHGGAGDGTSERVGTANREALFAATAGGTEPPRQLAHPEVGRIPGSAVGRSGRATRPPRIPRLVRADAMLGGSLADLLTAASVFDELARAVGGGSDSFPEEMALSVVFTGVGPDFPR